MTNQEMDRLIEKIAHDEEYAECIADCKTPAELTDLLKEANISISEEEAKESIQVIKEKLEKDELDDTDLELVSGGWWGIIPALKATTIVLGGFGAAALIGGIVVMAMYSRSKKRR